MHFMALLFFLYTQLCKWRGLSLYQKIVQIFSQVNKKYPTFFLTWFNKFSRVPYPGLWVREMLPLGKYLYESFM